MADEAVKAPAKKKKDEKYRKRDPRSWENVIKATANMSPEEKLQHLETVYNELYNENRTCTANLQAREKQYAQFLKEHEKDRAELSKSILAKGQLESLCRELQKQNKLIKEENVARIKEEEDRRREVANTFTERLNTLTSLITESKDKSNKVKEENQNMAQKLTELYEQYQQRESHLENVTKQLDLQKKLAETQAKKAEIEHEAEKQTFESEKNNFEMQLEQYQREVVLLQEKNRSLEAQVDLYKSQYTDFETTMSKSSKVFDTFKEEMAKMSKQLHTLETERNDIKKRWQSSVNSLIALSEQHVALSKEQAALEKRLLMFQKLCRQLQEDRSAFLKQLKENNIVPVVPTVVNGDCTEEKQVESCKPQKSNKKNAEGKKGKKMSEEDVMVIESEPSIGTSANNTSESPNEQSVQQPSGSDLVNPTGTPPGTSSETTLSSDPSVEFIGVEYPSNSNHVILLEDSDSSGLDIRGQPTAPDSSESMSSFDSGSTLVPSISFGASMSEPALGHAYRSYASRNLPSDSPPSESGDHRSHRYEAGPSQQDDHNSDSEGSATV